MQGPADSRKVRFDAFTVDLRAGEVYKHSVRLKLQDQPFRVLSFLLERPGDMVARDELRQKLWPADTFVDFETGLNSAIKRLRDVLGDSAEKPRYIETLPRRGYRFIGSLDHVQALPPQIPAQAAANGSRVVETIPIPPAAVEPPRHRLRLAFSLGLAVVALALAIFFSLAPHGTSSSLPAPIRSLAVLPLKNLSGDAAQEYLADGMTESLIGRLSGIHDLRVISRTSVMRFKDTQLSLPEIARMLQVDAIVEGSVIREGHRIRVHAQLIRAATDEHFWSEAYDRELQDVLGMQSDVAQSIARKVEVTVTGEEHARLSSARTVSPEMYEAYLKGRFVKSYSRAELERSITYFEGAIQKDPTFAPVYVGLADAYDSLGTIFVGAPPSEARVKQASAAQKALELDPGNAEAHALLGDVLQRRWQWADAEAEYKRAIELSPNNAAAHIQFATWLLCQGRAEEAVAWSRRAVLLDPLGATGTFMGYILFEARRYDEAILRMRNVLALHPDDAAAHWYLGFALIANNQPAEAIPVLEEAVALTDRGPGAIGVLIRAYAHAGRRADALKLLAELRKRDQAGYVPTGAFVNAYLGLGDNEQALVWLERGCQEQSNIMQFLKVHPYFDPIRGDPRFKDLVRRVGLLSGS
jgi:TolB-like protein/DNA-binding winged helix-turn-helix (wHTH) protein/Flp pilus assembly protein TadD